MSKRHRARYRNYSKIRLDAATVQAWRLRKQISQDRAAELIGMSPVTYRRCERGQLVQALSAARLAKRVGVPLSKLQAS